MKLRTFLIGVLWAGIAAAAPIATTLCDDFRLGKQIDWKQTARISVFNSAAGIAAYWRKHKALLKFPPDIAAAINDQITPQD